MFVSAFSENMKSTQQCENWSRFSSVAGATEGAKRTVASAAGTTAAWYKYASKVLGVDDFGESAPGDQVFLAKGLTPAGLASLAK